MNDRYCIFLLTVLLMAASVAYAASPVPPQMPQDPALSSGVLPNGIAYYIVANPSEKGMAEFAFVRRMAVPDSLRGRAVYDARYSVTDIPRFSPATVRDYAAKYGASSAMCRRSVPVHVRVTDDSAVYRFGTFPVSGGNVTDSTLLLIFSIAEGLDTDVPAQDALHIVLDAERPPPYHLQPCRKVRVHRLRLRNPFIDFQSFVFRRILRMFNVLRHGSSIFGLPAKIAFLFSPVNLFPKIRLQIACLPASCPIPLRVPSVAGGKPMGSAIPVFIVYLLTIYGYVH